MNGSSRAVSVVEGSLRLDGQRFASVEGLAPRPPSLLDHSIEANELADEAQPLPFGIAAGESLTTVLLLQTENNGVASKVQGLISDLYTAAGASGHPEQQLTGRLELELRFEPGGTHSVSVPLATVYRWGFLDEPAICRAGGLA